MQAGQLTKAKEPEGMISSLVMSGHFCIFALQLRYKIRK